MKRPAPPLSGTASDCAPDAVGIHPLQAFPYFRDLPSGPWHSLAYTLVWNCAIGTLFCLVSAIFSGRLPSFRAFLVYLAISNFIGYAIHALFMAGSAVGLAGAAGQGGFLARLAYFSAVPTLGVIAGFAIASAVFDLGFSTWLTSPGWITSVATSSVVISLILSGIFFWREKSAQAEATLEREQRRAAESEQLALAANLRALQAQIEPHFLFNTLANVTSLIDTDPARARRMLESFIRFLRASLAATRRERTTLADEFTLIRDFLDVLQVRMAGRLQVAMELPPELAALEIPPMLLQPLVENAIRHGLEPQVEGGLLTLRASRADTRLVLEVADTGAGFAGATSDGLGLANIRERLRLAHGSLARLAVLENRPAGTLVRLELPLEAA